MTVFGSLVGLLIVHWALHFGSLVGLLDTTEMNWDRVMDVNSKGYWLGARSAVRQFLRQEINPITGLRGRVINISSQHGMVCCPRDIAYGVSKACAVYMTRQIAVDFAKDHVACNAVAPGKIVTGCDSDVRPYSIMRTPCPRMGRPSDVAVSGCSCVLWFR